jgi:GAF domain-containing protein
LCVCRSARVGNAAVSAQENAVDFSWDSVARLRYAACTELSQLPRSSHMQTPAVPANESSRIAALHALNILDTAPEERFDRLTRIAKRVFNVPYSTISMIDDERQWFKSIQGLSLCQTSRDISFCAHAILFDEILYVENALKDERFHDNPVVVGDPKIRFYAGCSLNMNGFKMGTFCVFDRKPRAFSAEDRQLLKDLASLAEQELAVPESTISH